ncbi:MAG: hypothetical protein KatS3mg034_1084 [Vicingaceae bacterium]|nr:MAG: hypothetical protein KatS3mg034_1084 [Vicingaceae bacterium]
MSATTIQTIEKEKIPELHFPKTEVLEDNQKKLQRKLDLERALILGNGSKSKVKIIFIDDQSTKQVETTIWGLTEDRVILKKGVMIPICRIIEVRLI